MFKGTEFAVSGQRITVDAPLSIIPLHLRGGYILPTQQPANTTVYRYEYMMTSIINKMRLPLPNILTLLLRETSI